MPANGPLHYHVISSGHGVVAGDRIFATKAEAEAIVYRLRETRPDAQVAVRECEAEACAPTVH